MANSGQVATGTEVITHATQANSGGMLGLAGGIAPIDQADLLFKDAAGVFHVHEVKNTANAMAQKLRDESAQLESTSASGRRKTQRHARRPS